MVEIGQGEAKEFLEKITSGDNVAIITDHDPDGFTSGALFYDYCLKKGARVKQFTFIRGTSSVENFNLDEFTTIITTDINSGHLAKTIEKYCDKKILLMDHHPKNAELPESVLEYRTLDRGYIPSARSAYELTGGKYWLSLVGCFADAAEKYSENDDFLKEGLEVAGMSEEEFKNNVAWKLSNVIIYLDSDPSKAFSLIRGLKDPSEVSLIEEYSEPIESEAKKILNSFESEKEDLGGITYFYFEPKYPVKPVVTSISLRKENLDKIFLFASPKTDGSDNVSISARSQTGRIDMAKLLKIGIGDMEGEYGGHFKASGATIMAKDLEKFKENIRKYARENL
jgi:single-stranded DNA-specific DHH superfamily exonuclease